MPRLLLVILLTALTIGSPPAHAAEGYRYWNYFHLQDGSWAFSKVGAGQYQPKDGDVEGYRYGTSTTQDGIPPRTDLEKVSFETVCGNDRPPAGQKRVAVVIDYGTRADAEGDTPPTPRAECAVVEEAANGQQVLDAVADVRADKGITCALDGYPAAGCGEPVSGVSETADEQPVAFELPSTGGDDSSSTEAADQTADDGGLSWPLVAIVVLVIAIAVGALVLSRRDRSA